MLGKARAEGYRGVCGQRDVGKCAGRGMSRSVPQGYVREFAVAARAGTRFSYLECTLTAQCGE